MVRTWRGSVNPPRNIREKDGMTEPQISSLKHSEEGQRTKTENIESGGLGRGIECVERVQRAPIAWESLI